MSDVERLARDLRDERDALAGALAPLDAAAFACETPAPGWTVRNQVTHLAFFDEVAMRAIGDPESFERDVDRSDAAIDTLLHSHLERGEGCSPRELLAWWASANQALRDAATAAAPGVRVPWYGPSMSVRSMLTARIMETWAHGVDVRDALGLPIPATERLRHIAHLGVATFGFSFRANGLDIPAARVRVELTGPDGSQWEWGEPNGEVVRGSAIDFCLVVTQRRHVADTALVVDGDAAQQWITIAQAFAGPPGAGREPSATG